MGFFTDVFKSLIDFILPPHCPICKKYLQSAHALCPDCFGHIRFITHPLCQRCGRPFEFQIPEEPLCGVCCTKIPLFQKARAAFVYDSFSKELILPFKHGDKTELTPLLTTLMMTAGAELFPDNDLILSVPLHKTRLMKRKYNQAGLLAKSLSERLHKPYLPHVLIRNKATSSQGHMRAAERKQNVANAFILKYPEKIKGKRILLIDDVMTTGATLNECARLLLKNGAKSVCYLTLARVLKV